MIFLEKHSIFLNDLFTHCYFLFSECVDMIADEFFTEQEVKEIWCQVVGGDEKLADFKAFMDVNQAIDEAV